MDVEDLDNESRISGAACDSVLHNAHSDSDAEEAEVRTLELKVRKRRAKQELQRLDQEEKALRSATSTAATDRRFVQLNVGGTHFDTTADTLRSCAFFDAMIHGGYSESSDQGRHFIDRDATLFSHLLSFLRNRRRPSSHVLNALGSELTLEAEYYGCDDFLHELRGDTNPFDLRGVDRKILRDEEECLEVLQSQVGLESWTIRQWEERLLIDIFSQPATKFRREAAQSLELPLLFDHHDVDLSSDQFCSSLAVRTFSEFRSAFNKLTDGLLDDIDDPRGLVFAGGSVLSALTGTNCSDIDIFVVNLTNAAAQTQFASLLKAVKKNRARIRAPRNQANPRLVVSRTRLCTTMYRGMKSSDGDEPDGVGMLPVQMVLSIFRSPVEVILNFDVDCCCVLYDMSAEKVLCLPRSRRSLNTRCNIADTNMRSPSYERRLEKYAERGFAIAVPGLRLDRVKEELFNVEYYHDPDTGKLLRLGAGTKLDESTVHKGFVWGRSPWTGGREFELKANLERSADQIGGLQRLLVLDSAKRPGARVHSTNIFEEEMLGSVAFHVLTIRKAPLSMVVLATTEPPKPTRVAGQASDSESSEQEESSAGQVLKKLLRMLSLARSAVTQHILMSAAPEEIGQAVHDMKAKEETLNLDVLENRFKQVCMRRLSQKRPIGVVYDVTSVEDLQHTDLKYVLDARRGCLQDIDDDDDEFLRFTGVTPLLKFQLCVEHSSSPYFGRHARSQYHAEQGNWFAGIY